MKSYISSKAEKGLKSKIHGKGIFAVKPIKKGEIIAIKKGHLLTRKQYLETEVYNQDSGLQIDDNLYIAPIKKDELEGSMICINHSCDPNIGMKDATTFVAMQDIEPDEELTIDYAMIEENNNLSVKCNCGSDNCRKTFTGSDWKNADLQKKYKGFFSPFIQKRIDKLRQK